MEIKLTKPLVLVAATETTPEKKLEKLDLNLDALTGADFAVCERAAVMESGNIPSVDPRLNAAFQVHLAARACGVPVEILRRLGLVDFGEVVMAVRDFFLVTD